MNPTPIQPTDADGRALPPTDPELREIWDLLENVKDPEIPVLTIRDLGILRGIFRDRARIVVTITPTYSGCPAMHTIEQEIVKTLGQQGVSVDVRSVLSPAWSTDWLSDEGREKLREYGIAPPVETSASKRSLLGEDPLVPCPQCGSNKTRKLSEFGSTACKALYNCDDCQQPFDYFKCL